jgi:GT2 family glycosyltransferase
MRITVVTPWHDHRELERDYWAAMRVADVDVLVIDNGSEPRLPNGYRLPWNSGFSHACNVGLNLARTEAVLFLNNDIAALAPAWDEPIREALDDGVLVGANLRFDPHGGADGQPLPYLDGWCLAGMRDDLIELGGFDEDYAEPAYYSDNDLCLRARAEGFALREVKVGLRHKLNQTAGHATDPGVRSATLVNRQRFMNRARELMAVPV